MTSDLQRILVVEDDKDLRITLAATLRAEGYFPIDAATAVSARQHIAESKADLILLDLGLPDGDGMSLLAAMRKEGNLIALTARGETDLEHPALLMAEPGFGYRLG